MANSRCWIIASDVHVSPVMQHTMVVSIFLTIWCVASFAADGADIVRHQATKAHITIDDVKDLLVNLKGEHEPYDVKRICDGEYLPRNVMLYCFIACSIVFGAGIATVVALHDDRTALITGASITSLAILLFAVLFAAPKIAHSRVNQEIDQENRALDQELLRFNENADHRARMDESQVAAFAPYILIAKRSFLKKLDVGQTLALAHADFPVFAKLVQNGAFSITSLRYSRHFVEMLTGTEERLLAHLKKWLASPSFYGHPALFEHLVQILPASVHQNEQIKHVLLKILGGLLAHHAEDDKRDEEFLSQLIAGARISAISLQNVLVTDNETELF